MQAMLMSALGEPEGLELTTLPDRAPGPGEVAIEVRAIGCNFADTLICRGRYQLRPALPFAPGSEVAGTLVALGPGVEGLAVGQAVSAQVGYGGYATRVIADARRVQRIPEGMPAADACALGIAYQTSYLALVDRARLQPGETLLVHAAAGGVGLAALQIGKALGARVIAGASAEKLAFCSEQGADEVVDTRAPGWVERVRELTGNRGADVIYESVGGDVFEGSLKCIAWAGRLLVIGFSSGDIPALKLNRVLLKHIDVLGLNVGAYHENDPRGLRDATERLFALYAAGKIKPVIHARYPLRDAAKALRELSDRKTVGKLILEP
ncbi:MAG TPA: NADPH:quinone oxidoreductase family protein [Polyangiales bacterium]|nr:NADPH:quinone oxidoreductase family protein [Polyangiales bacterium]